MRDGQMLYRATAGADVVVTTQPALLIRILVGKDVSSGIIEVSDSKTDGDGNVKIYAEGSTLMTANGGAIEVGAVFENGITADLTNQTNVTFVFANLGKG